MIKERKYNNNNNKRSTQVYSKLTGFKSLICLTFYFVILFSISLLAKKLLYSTILCLTKIVLKMYYSVVLCIVDARQFLCIASWKDDTPLVSKNDYLCLQTPLLHVYHHHPYPFHIFVIPPSHLPILLYIPFHDLFITTIKRIA